MEHPSRPASGQLFGGGRGGGGFGRNAENNWVQRCFLLHVPNRIGILPPSLSLKSVSNKILLHYSRVYSNEILCPPAYTLSTSSILAAVIQEFQLDWVVPPPPKWPSQNSCPNRTIILHSIPSSAAGPYNRAVFVLFLAAGRSRHFVSFCLIPARH